MKRILLASLFAVSLSSTLFAQAVDVRRKNYNVKKNVALEGYDPVSYFAGKPVEGEEDIQYSYKGITYQFANSSDLDKFKTSPEKFEPAYGGWCAFAMGESGEKVKVDPETYKIVEGKLYVFYNFWGNNTLTDWNKREKELKSRGDQNWKKFDPNGL